MKAILVRIGIDHSYGNWNAPADPDSRKFVYVPIREAALQDRGHMLLFQPTADEVHVKANQWFQDAEILSWCAANLHRIPEPSLRLYIRAAELKRAGMDWTQLMPLTPENLRKRLVLELKADKTHATEESRVRAFVARGGGCRATYFNYSRKLKESRPL